MKIFQPRRTYLFAFVLAVLLFPLRAAFTQTATPPPPNQSLSARLCVLYDLGDRPGDPLAQLQQAGIVEGPDGYLYTTSTNGGTRNFGTIFKISPTDGKPPIVLYNFDITHGAGPQSGLKKGSDGNFYGTTYQGGKYSAGTVFSVTPQGSMTVLWNFHNGAIDPPIVGRQPTEQEKMDAAGAYPISAPVQLGNTLYGVASYANNQQWGVVYQISGGVYHALYQFKPADVLVNGSFPSDLTMGPGGSLYGTTVKGAASYGTIYQVTGGGITTLHKFDALSSGSLGVIQAQDGSLYGTALGPNTTYGLIYKLDPKSQVYTVIHRFNGNDGAAPVSSLTEGKDGLLYGVTKGGGTAGRGVIYRLSTNPANNYSYTVLFNFDMNDGRYAMSPPFQHSNGDFYGVTNQGGNHDAGVVYHLNLRMYPTPSHDSAYMAGVLGASDPIPSNPMAVVMTKRAAYQRDANGVLQLKYEQGVPLNDGVTVLLACMRDPHIVQFVYREKIGLDGKGLGGSYTTSWGTFQLTTDPANPYWHTDGIGKPNAYYDQAPGASHFVNLTQAIIFDQPSLAADGVVFYEAARETWRVTAKDFLICNCKVARVVNWARETRYNMLTNQRGPLQYVNVSIEAPPATDTTGAWATQQMQWINNQLQIDGYDPIP